MHSWVCGPGRPRGSRLRFYRLGHERLHLADGDGVQLFDSIVLRQVHVDEFGIHALQIGQNKQLLEGCVVAHVPVNARISFSPFSGGLTEERNVEEIRFVGVGRCCLLCCDLGGDQVRLNSVCV